MEDGRNVKSVLTGFHEREGELAATARSCRERHHLTGRDAAAVRHLETGGPEPRLGWPS
jgi:hypothetical protein